MKSPLLLLCAAPVIGFAAGWLTRADLEPSIDFQLGPPRTPATLNETAPAPRGLALEQALRMSDTFELQAVTARTVLDMNLEEVQVAIERLGKVPMDEDVIRTLAHLFRRYGELDAASALAAAETFPIPSRRDALINSALRGLTFRDPHAGWKAGLERNRLMPVVETLRQTGPLDFLFEQFVALPEGAQKTELSRSLANYFSRYETEALVPIIDSLPPGTSRTQFVAAFAAEWARTDPAAAVEWIGGLPPDEGAKPLDAAVITWLRSSSESLFTWLHEQPASPGLDRILLRAVGAGLFYSAHFPEAMVPLAEKFTDASQRDELQRSIIVYLTRQEPQRAAPLAEQISDPDLRRQMLTTVMDRWQETDKAAAQNYILTSPNLTHEERMLAQNALDRASPPPDAQRSPGFSP